MKISALPAAGPIDGTEEIPGRVSAGTVKILSQAIANLFKGTKGASIASAATVDLGAATGNTLHITGNTGPITSFGTAADGVERTLIFDSTPTITHDPATLICLTGANIVAAAGDTARVVSEGAGAWRMLSYSRKSGAPLVAGGVSSVNGASGAVTLALPCDIIVALGDETTAITTGTALVTIRAPRAMTLSAVKASLSTASSSGLPQFDVKKNGTTIFSTKPTIDVSEKTTATAATASVLSTTAIAADDELTFDIVTAGTGAKGAKITLVANG